MQQIEQTIRAFRKLKILVIGDVMLDCYLYGSVQRISPEAPVPVVNLTEKDYRLGGAANVSLNIKALGAKPFLLSVVGDDENGKKLLELLPSADLSNKYVETSVRRKTTTKTRIIAQNQQVVRLDEEDCVDVNAAEKNALLTHLKNILDSNDIHAILFQDYNKGVLSKSVIREVMLEALKRDIPTVVDPKDKHFYAYKRATLFKPNLKEINANLPFHSEPTLSDLNRAATYLNQQLNNTLTLITLSDKGVYYQSKDSSEVLPTIPRNIADVCGAGDSVVSIAALAVALKLPIKELALLANLAGGQVCEKVGVVPVDVRQLALDYQAVMASGK
ncbi:MAG: bifunctional ADP-heptose synthase [Bacteroidota bacterium]